MTVVCEPLDFSTASDAMQRTHRNLGSVNEKLLGDLSGLGGMAGSDSAGSQFASTYDEATAQVFVSFSNFSTGAAQLTDLLHATGLNHANADDPNLPQGIAPSDYPPSPALSGMPQPSVSVPPSARGEAAGEPWGWGLVSHFVGYLWPNGDEDQLQSARDAWGMAAAGLETAAMSVSECVRMVQGQQSPEVPAVIAACEEYRQQLHDVADCCRDLGAACASYAADLKTAHENILDMLEQFLWETAAIGTAGVVGSFFSLGAAGAAGGSAVSARAAAYGGRIARAVEKLIAATGIVGRAVAAAGAKVVEVASKVSAAVASRGRILAEKIPGLNAIAKASLRQELDDAATWSGPRLPTMNGPKNGYLVKRDADGAITNYTEFDANGLGIKRVDLTGKPHFDGNAYTPTPHVVDIVHNTNPKTGEVFARTLNNSVRPARPEEIP